MVQECIDQQRLARRPPFVDGHLRDVGVPRHRIDTGRGKTRGRHQRVSALQNGVGGLGRAGAATAGYRRVAVRFYTALGHVPASRCSVACAAGYAPTNASIVPLPSAGGTTTPSALFTPTAPSAFSAAATSATITSPAPPRSGRPASETPG